jgi:hypothetical protein
LTDPRRRQVSIIISCPRTWWILILCECKCWRSLKILHIFLFHR